MNYKKLFMAAAASALCAGTASAQDKAHDWAQFYRYAEANAEMTASPFAILMGDSITDFWVGYDPDFFKDNNLAGRGISGQTTSEMLVRFRQDVIALKPKVVVILAGVNDIAENNGPISIDNILGNIRSMVELAKAHQIKPVVCSVLPAGGFSWRPDIKPAPIIVELNRRIVEMAKVEKIPFVDYYSAMANEQGALREGLSFDGCHPNIKGYRIMEPILLRTLQKL